MHSLEPTDVPLAQVRACPTPDDGCHQASVAPDSACFPLLGSLGSNELFGVNRSGRGNYTAEGILAITEMLKVNTTLQSIRCALCVCFLTKRQ